MRKFTKYLFKKIVFSAQHHSITKLCCALYKYKNKIKIDLGKILYNFVVHSNEIPCRKRWRLGFNPVYWYCGKDLNINKFDSEWNSLILNYRDKTYIILPMYGWIPSVKGKRLRAAADQFGILDSLV